MKIKLTEKYKPFSHEAGTSLLIPKSPWKAKIFPARIVLESLVSSAGAQTFIITPHIKGPLKRFTVMQDLEKNWVRVFGEGPQGYFSYRLVASCHKVVLFFERGPEEGILFTFEGKTKILKRKEELVVDTTFSTFPERMQEKMHFGCSKKQDWALVKRRQSIQEILPIWFELGKHMPSYPLLEVGASHLLIACQKQIEAKANATIGASFIDLFKTGFEGIFSPLLNNKDAFGYREKEEVIPGVMSPLTLLGEGARLIRALFIQKREKEVAILPCLPKELHAGRFIHIQISDTLTADLEWSKKLVRCLVLHPTEDQEVTFAFQAAVDSFRLRAGKKRGGKFIKAGEALSLKAGTLYILDRFQK